LGAGRAQIADDGALVFDRPGAVERFANGEHGVEQSWHFAARPEPVRVRVSGQDYVS